MLYLGGLLFRVWVSLSGSDPSSSPAQMVGLLYGYKASNTLVKTVLVTFLINSSRVIRVKTKQQYTRSYKQITIISYWRETLINWRETLGIVNCTGEKP